MKLRILSVLLAACTILATGSSCGKTENPAGGDFPSDVVPITSGADTSAETPSDGGTTGTANPLTGLSDLSSSAVGQRPVAVMVNNIKTAWSVQTGLGAADIVYETYVEGGITRLMAVYKDISKAPKIGTVRSARYSYVDLATGHDAIYVHAGLDPVYCKNRMDALKTDDFDLNTGAASASGFRVDNGKAAEHTLYTSGDRLLKGLKDSRRMNLKKDTGMWMKFRAPDAPAVPGGGACTSLTVPFSSDYISGFSYNASTKMYDKSQGGAPQKDYLTGKQIAFKNVLVLFSKITTFDDGKHMKTDLSSGEGYYVSEGGYTAVKWKKGEAASPLKITMADGSELQANAGSTWVCFTDINQKSSVTIQ